MAVTEIGGVFHDNTASVNWVGLADIHGMPEGTTVASGVLFANAVSCLVVMQRLRFPSDFFLQRLWLLKQYHIDRANLAGFQQPSGITAGGGAHVICNINPQVCCSFRLGTAAALSKEINNKAFLLVLFLGVCFKREVGLSLANETALIHWLWASHYANKGRGNMKEMSEEESSPADNDEQPICACTVNL